MRLLVQFLFVFIPSFASKEHIPLQNLPEKEKDILFELVKRLGNSGDLGELGWKDDTRCEVSTNVNSIIKKVDSEENGAKFLTLHKNTETNEACSDLCCKNASCDLAVYENKDQHYCYLFQCGGKCKFGHHSSYLSNTVVHRSTPAAHSPELDLINLDQPPQPAAADRDRSGGDTSPPAPTTPTPAPAPTIRAHSVGLEGAHCERDIHCEDPNAVCNFKKCRCREGYYQKGHICRQVCPASNSECLELGTLGRGPQCVRQDQVCDSLMQCADGSDEFNCPQTDEGQGAGAGNRDNKPQQHGSISADRQKSVRPSGPSGPSGPPNTPHQGSKPAKADKTLPSPSSVDTAQHKAPSHTPQPSQPHTARKPTPTKTPTANQQDSNDNNKDSNKDSIQHDTEGNTNSHKSSQTGGAQGQAGVEHELTHDSDAVSLVRSQEIFIARQKLSLPTEPANMQGPIIALALGLAFTLILLVFVACRLRNVRRRLRKGRPLHSNEADYLINGMYL